MPLQQIKRDGRKGWRWGTNGKVYFGPNAKDKALKQARAIKATGWTENSFCPTGIGGGIDPSCSPTQSHATKVAKAMGIKAEVKVEIVPSNGTGGSASWEYNPETKEHRIAPRITIKNNGSLTAHQLEKIVEHELVHIKQSEDGRLLMKKNDSKNNAIFWDGKEVIQEKDLGRIISRVKNPNSSHKARLAALTEYKSLPWENEAYEVADPKIDGLTTNAVPKKRSKASYNPLRMDPTRTAALRRKFSAEVKRRYKLLKQDIRKFVVDDDCFGLEQVKHVRNAFCPTGEGGGQDNSCGPGLSHSVGAIKLGSKEVKVTFDNEVTSEDSALTAKKWLESIPENVRAKSVAKRIEIFDAPEDLLARLEEHGIDPEIGPEGVVRGAFDFSTGILYSCAWDGYKNTSRNLMHEFGHSVLGMSEDAAESFADAYSQNKLVTNAPKHKFQFLSTSAQQQAFLAWLKKQVQFRIMGNTIEQIEKAWWTQYAEAGYRQGAGRAFDDVQQKATGKPGVGDFYQGSKDEFLRSSFGRPVQVERIKILASRTYQDLVGVNEAMATGISRSLLDGLVRGDNPRTIADDIEEDVEGIGQRRAETIARTEIIRAHAEGQLDALEAMGVEQVGVMVEWSTAGDDRVCSLCEELEGVVLKLSEAHNKIPFHPNCVVGETIIEAPSILAVMSAEYTGLVHEVFTTDGRSISMTSHHIVLTQRGWVFAKDLTDSDYLVNSPHRKNEFGLHCPNNDETHPTIRDVFHAFIEVVDEFGITKSLSMPEDLHGDGQSIDSEIHIVSADSVLRSDWQFSEFAETIERSLNVADIPIIHPTTLQIESSLSAFFKRANATANSLMSSFGITDVLLARSARHHQPIGLGLTSGSMSGFLNDLSHNASNDVEMLGEKVDAVTSEKEFNDLISGIVVKIERVSTRHVTNLQVFDASTDSTLYSANGFITSNCRCSFLPANVGEDEDDQIRGKGKIESAFEDAGLEVEISSERPESILNMNPNHDEQGRFASGDNGSSSQPTEWSDKQTFKHAVSTGMVEDGLHTVEPFVYKVKDGKAEIQKGLNSKFDYDTGEYKITERELPPERLEDREYVHHTQADIASAIDLKIGSGYGRWGENEFNAVYFFQDKTHYADGNTFGTKKHKIKLAPGTKIARPGPELAEALEKHEGFAQEKMIKAGYHGYAKLDERGDVWELALFDTSRIVQNVFCPTGEGGGVDPSCSPGQGSALPKDASALKNLKLVNFLGGSTGAKLMEDEHGNKYVWKTGKSHGQIRAEQAAHDAYVAAGVPMVESKLYETEDGPVKIAKYVEGKTYNELDAKDKAIVKAEMQKHFAVDAVLANWDVVGQSNDNVMLGKDGKVYRIDVGGSLDYRAQGGPKGTAWNDQAIEMESMRTSYKNPNAKAMFGDMTKEQVLASAKMLHNDKYDVLDAVPEQYKDIISKRMDAAVKYAVAMKDPVNPADTLPKVIIPANLGAGSGHMSESSKAFKEELKSGLPNLHHGKGLADHLKSTGMKATETYFKKIEVLNPDGIKNGTLVVPGQIKALKEKMIAHMKAALPPVNYKTGHLSIKKWETGKESQYVKTSTVGAKAWAGSHEAIDYSVPVLALPKSKGKVDGDRDKWLNSLNHEESNAIGTWKGGGSKGIRINIAEGKIGLKEKGITTAIEKAPKYTGIAYRGIHGEFAESIAQSIMAGGVGSVRQIPYPAGLSRNSSTAIGVGGGTQLFLRIRANGAKMLDGSHGYAHEQEMLLPTGSKMRVLGFTQNKQVEYYDHAGKKEGTTKVKYFVDLEHLE